MQWIETPESPSLLRFGYVQATSTLTVEFKSGGTYQYFDVPQWKFDAMTQASSKGQF